MEFDPKLNSKHIYDAFADMQKRDYDHAEVILNEGVVLDKNDQDEPLLALLYSALGVLYKLKKDFRQAWRFYDQAEKLLPDNAVLKLISARLLIESFNQYDIALRKMEKVEAQAAADPAIAHQLYAISGLAHAKQGHREKAKAALEALLTAGFEGLGSAGNIDFKLIEVCIRKGWHKALCDRYLLQALEFAKKTGEEHYIRLFDRLLKAAQKAETQVL